MKFHNLYQQSDKNLYCNIWLSILLWRLIYQMKFRAWKKFLCEKPVSLYIQRDYQNIKKAKQFKRTVTHRWNLLTYYFVSLNWMSLQATIHDIWWSSVKYLRPDNCSKIGKKVNISWIDITWFKDQMDCYRRLYNYMSHYTIRVVLTYKTTNVLHQLVQEVARKINCAHTHGIFLRSCHICIPDRNP
jgi:hypothetical protein